MVDAVEHVLDVFSTTNHFLMSLDVFKLEARHVTTHEDSDQREGEEADSHSGGGN